MFRFLRFLTFLFLVLAGFSSILHAQEVPENFEFAPSVLLEVPLMRQDNRYSCAGHSLAMVLSFLDKKDYDPAQVWDKTGTSANVAMSQGNDMYGLKQAAKAFGFDNSSFLSSTNIRTIKFLLNQGLPVVLNVRNFYRESSHAVVIIGYDAERLFFNDPANGSVALSYEEFERKWWAWLSYPQGQAYKTAFVVYPK